MGRLTATEVESVLSGFAEAMSRLLVDAYQQHFAELDLTLPQAQVLRILRRGPMPTGQLAAEMKISAPAITQLTNRLTAKGLIERRASEGDRRLVLVALSARGRRLVDEIRKRRSEIFRGALARLDESEQQQIFASLRKVQGALEDYESDLRRRGAGKSAAAGAERE